MVELSYIPVSDLASAETDSPSPDRRVAEDMNEDLVSNSTKQCVPGRFDDSALDLNYVVFSRHAALNRPRTARRAMIASVLG